MSAVVRRHVRRVSIGLSLLSMMGCGEHAITPANENYGAVLVRAMSDEGDPVLWLQVELHDPGRPMGFGQTGSDGMHGFQLVPAGVYLLALSPPAGWVLSAEQLNPITGLRLARGEFLEVDVTLTDRIGSIRVLVVDSMEIPLPDVSVEIRSLVKALGFARTGEDGVASIHGLPEGTHILVVAPPVGHTLPELVPKAPVLGGDTTDVTVRLVPPMDDG
jgi:hypothetical protein